MIELMIALCVASVFTMSAVGLVYGSRVLGRIAEQKQADVTRFDSVFSSMRTGAGNGGGGVSPPIGIDMRKVWYGDDTVSVSSATGSIDVATTLSDVREGYGASSCRPFFSNLSNSPSPPNPQSIPPYEMDWLHPDFGSSNYPTDIVVRHGMGYATADSAVQARDDVFVFDMRRNSTSSVTKADNVGSIHTGPGAAAVAMAGHYLYVANTSATNQFQVIDIADRSHPYVAARLKLPLPDASSSAPAARSIFYAKSRVYLGTEKWNGQEFAVIDVSYPPAPVYLGGFEVGSVVNSISVRDDRAYLAVADGGRVVILNVSSPSDIRQIDSFSPAGGSLENGNRIVFHHDELWFGRSGGGFNTTSYQELYRIASTSAGQAASILPVGHVPGGVRGVAVIDPYVFVAAGGTGTSGGAGTSGGEIEVWQKDRGTLIGSIPLGITPIAMSCDESDLYVVADVDGGIIRIHFK